MRVMMLMLAYAAASTTLVCNLHCSAAVETPKCACYRPVYEAALDLVVELLERCCRTLTAASKGLCSAGVGSDTLLRLLLRTARMLQRRLCP